MTARFAYRRTTLPAKTLATAKPTRSPAMPAASLPEGSLPAQGDAFKEVSVYKAGGAGRITIAIPMGEYEHMLSFAGESHAAVEKACLVASKALSKESDRTWSETVASGAMNDLMTTFASKCKVKPGRKAK